MVLRWPPWRQSGTCYSHVAGGKAELLEMFKHNAEVKLARVNGFISPSASNEQLLNGLYKLWKFKDYDNK